MPRISTVLFDADGVVQFAGELYAHLDRRYGWPVQRVDDFFWHLFHERHDYDGSLTGESDLVPVVAAALADWGCAAPAEEFVRDWFTLGAVPDPDALALVAALRRHGIRCGLASNQDSVRAGFMDEELGYRTLFDDRFYSSRLGYAKPDVAFFQAVLAALGTHPEQILFVDDKPDNVEAARLCGLHAEVHGPGDKLRDTLLRYHLPASVAVE